MNKEFFLRAPLKNEAKKAEILFNRYDLYVSGEKKTGAGGISNSWNLPRVVLEDDARIIIDKEGRWLGYAMVWNNNPPYVKNTVVLKVDPVFFDSEIEKTLFEWAENRAYLNISKAPGDEEVFISHTLFDFQKKKIGYLKDHGFSEKRYVWRMEIDLDDSIIKPQFPAGITISTFLRKNNLMDIVKCYRECVYDPRGYIEKSVDEEYADWEQLIKGELYHDPAYWFLAYSGNTLAGFSLCNSRTVNDENTGYIESICVKKEFRRKGIATALIGLCFEELKKANKNKVRLHVDSGSPTGAVKLYKQAGMKVDQCLILMEKIIRTSGCRRIKNPP